MTIDNPPQIVDKLDSLSVVLDVVNVATKLHEQALTYPIVTKVAGILIDNKKLATPILEDNVLTNVPEGKQKRALLFCLVAYLSLPDFLSSYFLFCCLF